MPEEHPTDSLRARDPKPQGTCRGRPPGGEISCVGPFGSLGESADASEAGRSSSQQSAGVDLRDDAVIAHSAPSGVGKDECSNGQCSLQPDILYDMMSNGSSAVGASAEADGTASVDGGSARHDSQPPTPSAAAGADGMPDVDGLAMGLAQHDPLDMMMGALADMHEVSALHACTRCRAAPHGA